MDYILIYIQKDSTLRSLFFSGNCSTCFGWYLRPSLGAQTTVFTVSGNCETVTATCRYFGRVGTGLSVAWEMYWSVLVRLRQRIYLDSFEFPFTLRTYLP